MRELPSSTVTFLFTDVEGSTKLLHELGAEGYAGALAEHRRVIREACAAEGGVEVDTQGDAFFFAFATAPGALDAAASFTESLDSGAVRVRVGVHTGTPLVTDEGYVGDDVHFAARVAAAAHGGQVVVSAATAELVAIPLTDLGEHRLKDIAEAVPIFQLGDGSFPPLKTISNTNLPRPASSFVGRERELGEVLSRIERGARLLTLSGPGGSGKTRLAIEAASTLVPDYKAGVFWVGLAALRDETLVTETIAQSLGAKDGLAEHVGEREMLLLLDNLEQVIDSAPALSALLQACPNLTLLVTSRELLRVQGEVEYAVPPLAAPEAVSLFCERAQLEPSDEIAEVCARLDSLPLAVELAAARTKALSPAQILDRLSKRLDLLKGGRDADPRQQTLRATIEWSYELLIRDERRLLARLSVFVGGCTLEAAGEVCGADLDTLQSLVDKSLLRFSHGRYWMLETIREFAGERLDERGERESLERRHSVWMIRLVAQLADGTEGPFEYAWHPRLEPELDNLRSALTFLEAGGEFDSILDVATGVWTFWYGRGALHEGRRWFEAALRSTTDEPTARRAYGLLAAGTFAGELGEAASGYDVEALEIFRVLGDTKGMALALTSEGQNRRGDADYAAAESFLLEAVTHARRGGHEVQLAIALGSLADVFNCQEQYLRGLALGEEALTILRRLDGQSVAVAWALLLVAEASFGAGRVDTAVTAARECAALARAYGPATVLGYLLNLAAGIEAVRGRPEAAAAFMAAAVGFGERTGARFDDAARRARERRAQELRSELGDERFDAVFQQGLAMPFDDAVHDVIEALSRPLVLD